MKQIAIAGIAGAVVYYVWGMLAWMALPLHEPTIAGLPNEAKVTDSLQAQNLESGVYIVPWPSDPADMNDPNSTFMRNHARGPLYSIYYHREGETPMAPRVLLGGFVIDLLAATLAACLLSSALTGCCRSYANRVGFVLGLGIFVALVGHASYWNWMHFPLDYTLAFMADVIIGWTLAGLVIAAIMRPPAAEASEADSNNKT